MTSDTDKTAGERQGEATATGGQAFFKGGGSAGRPQAT